MPLLSFSTTVTMILSRDELSVCEAVEREGVQLVTVPDNGSYSPLHRVSALVAQITKQHVRSPLSLLQRNLWVTLGDSDVASVPLEHGSRGGNG